MKQRNKSGGGLHLSTDVSEWANISQETKGFPNITGSFKNQQTQLPLKRYVTCVSQLMCSDVTTRTECRQLTCFIYYNVFTQLIQNVNRASLNVTTGLMVYLKTDKTKG